MNRDAVAPQPNRLLTAEEVEGFARDGYLLVQGQLQPDWVDRLREGLDDFVRAVPRDAVGDGPDRWRRGYYMDIRAHMKNDRIRQFATTSPLPYWAKQLLGSSRVRVFDVQTLCKDRHYLSEQAWHQDAPYLLHLEDPGQIVSAWVAADPISADEGCLQLIPGSHRTTRYRAVFPGEAKGFSAADPTLPLPPSAEEVIAREREGAWTVARPSVSAGDVIFFNSRTLHYAPVPKQPKFRRVASLRYGTGAVGYSAAFWYPIEVKMEHRRA